MIRCTAPVDRAGRLARAASAAAVILLLSGGTGHGAVVYFSGQNISIPNTFAGVSVDLENGANSTALAGLGGGDANLFFGGALVGNDADQGATVPSWQPVRTGTGSLDPVANLAPGTTIGAGSTYAAGYGVSGDPNSHFGGDAEDFSDGGTGFIGFSLVIDDPQNPGSDLTVYGWMRVSLEDNDGTGQILEWAYEDTGSVFIVGVPEPSTAALAAIALAGLGLRRSRPAPRR